MDYKPYMRELIAAIEESDVTDNFYNELFGSTKMKNGKSTIDSINRIKRAVNEAKMCLSANGG